MRRHSLLREIAKVCSGLVIADLIGVIYFATNGFFPLTLLGVTWTGSMMPEVVFFDAAILVFLFHYGWNAKLPISSPSERTLLSIAGIIFLIVALVHLARLAFGWTLILGTFSAPAVISWAGVLIAGYLSYASFHFALKKR